MGGSSSLDASCVGTRVVVRRVLPGQTGPSGGPALTDVLGILEEWGETTLTVRPEDGEPVVIERAHVVAGKPVPPRPSVRLRVPVEVAEERAMDTWPPLETERLGAWALRAAGGFSARANSALVLGDPGVGWAEALARVGAFYRERSQPVWVQAMLGSDEVARLEADGWVSARPGEGPTSFRLAGLAQVRRTCAALLPADPPFVSLSPALSGAWLADDERARAHGDAARAVLAGPPSVVFASVADPADPSGPVVAKGRAALSERSDVWLGISDVWVAPSHRRSGLALAVLAELLGWGAEQGAVTAYLQVREDNPGGLALYDRLGFLRHHTYRYLRPPD